MNNRKRLLILTSRFPFPPLGGDKQFLFHVALALRENYRLTLLSICSNREEMKAKPVEGVFSEVHKIYLPRLVSYWNVLKAIPGRGPLQLAYYNSRSFRRVLDGLLPRHDAVLAHLIRTGQYVLSQNTEIPRILLMADAISMTYQRMSALPQSLSLWRGLYRLELPRLNAFERSCASEFDQTWLHSDVDRRFLGLEQKDVDIVPMGVDLDEFPFRSNPGGNVVAFIGNMSSSLNFDACCFFIKEIFPSLLARGRFRFRIIGACPVSVRKDLERHANVEVTGAVERIADAIDEVFCGVCPVRGGAGIQNKVLNYLALGIPCVSSRIGLEGLDAVDGRELFVYKTPDVAVSQILRIHGDSALRKTIAKNGRRFVEERHDWEKLHGVIREKILQALSARGVEGAAREEQKTAVLVESV